MNLRTFLVGGLLACMPVSEAAALNLDANVVGTVQKQVNIAAVSSNPFSTTGSSELVLATIQLAVGTTSSCTNSVTGVTGAGLTWTLISASDNTKKSVEIWGAFAPSPITAQTVTATTAVAGAGCGAYNYIELLSIISFQGINTSGVNGAGAIGATQTSNSAVGFPSTSLTTTKNGSWVIGTVINWSTDVLGTPAANQSIFATAQEPVSGVGFWSQYTNTVTPTAGTVVTLSDTNPSTGYAMAIVEILPAPATGFQILQ